MSALCALRRPRLAVPLLAALTLALPYVADAQAASLSDTARVRIVSIPGSLPQPRNAVVVLPSGYHASARRYPVLYLLHGYGGGHRNWIEKTNLLAYTARLPLIVVMPDAGNSWYANSAARPEERFEDYVAKDVPAFPPAGTSGRAADSWTKYRTTVDNSEYYTKYNFLHKLSDNIESYWECTASAFCG